MENQTPEKKKNVLFISWLVVVVLFVLPLGSIYFLDSGLQYHKTSVAELEELGKIGAFKVKNQNNLEITPEMLRGRVAVVNFFSENDSTARSQAHRIAKVHQVYSDVDDVLFLSFIHIDSIKNLFGLATSLGINDHKQWYLLGIDSKDWGNLSSNIYKLQNINSGVALVDTSMTIRRIYDINNDPEMGRLVEQIAIVLPKQKRRGM